MSGEPWWAERIFVGEAGGFIRAMIGFVILANGLALAFTIVACGFRIIAGGSP